MELRYANAPINGPIPLQLSYTVYYIDDLLSSSSLPFSNMANDIYNMSLTLKYSAQNECRCDYLDLSINIDNQRTISVFNKTDTFIFWFLHIHTLAVMFLLICIIRFLMLKHLCWTHIGHTSCWNTQLNCW